MVSSVPRSDVNDVFGATSYILGVQLFTRKYCCGFLTKRRVIARALFIHRDTLLVADEMIIQEGTTLPNKPYLSMIASSLSLTKPST